MDIQVFFAFSGKLRRFGSSCREAGALAGLRTRLEPATLYRYEAKHMVRLIVHFGGLVSMNGSETAGVEALLLGRMEYFKLRTQMGGT